MVLNDVGSYGEEKYVLIGTWINTQTFKDF